MPAPAFLTNDVVSLHPPEEGDIPFLRENEHDPRVRASRSVHKPVDVEWARQRVGGTMGRNDETLALLVYSGDTPVGFIYLIREHPNATVYRFGELAYWITPDEWGNGYATSASRLLLDYTFDELGLHRIEASTFASNEASKRVLEKLGFTEEGSARKAARIQGEWVDRLQYGILESEWKSTVADS